MAQHDGQEPELASFVLRRDSYSVQVVHVTDTGFWLRLDLGAADHVYLTDLVAGAQSPEIVAKALQLLLDGTGKTTLHTWRLMSVGGDAEWLREVVQAYAARTGRELQNWTALPVEVGTEIVALFSLPD